MVRTIITGAAGRMGMRLVSLTQETAGLSLTGAIEMKGHPALGKDAGEIAQIGKVGILLSDNLQTCLAQSDVVIDFTGPTSCLAHLEQVVNASKAMVIGTTGFSGKRTRRTQGQSYEGSLRIFTQHECWHQCPRQHDWQNRQISW